MSLLRFDWTRGSRLFMLFLHPLLLGDNLFFLLLLLSLLPSLDLALLLLENPFYLFSKAKGFLSLVLVSNSLGHLLLVFLLDVILVH